MKKGTKTQLVKKHLLQKKQITSWDAIDLYRISRLSAIIFVLRKDGWDIKTMPIVDKEGNRYAKYILKK